MTDIKLTRGVNTRKVVISILWPSFVSAGIALAALYVLVDPLLIATAVGLPLSSRVDIYSISFLFLWAQAILASAFCLFFAAPTKRASKEMSNQQNV